jgi:glycosyltransferase involved in cell wall biosynthesis
MKICFTANTAWNLAHFRKNHLLALLEMGAEVHAVAPPDEFVDDLVAMGIKYHPWKIERRSLNPTTEMASVHRLRKIYKQIKPDLVHHYTVKAVLYGTTAARLSGVKGIVNSVTGLPYIIVSPKKGMTKRFARWVAMKWYAWCVTGKNTHVILQNTDDLRELESFAGKVSKCSTITNGSGVALEHFSEKPLPQNDPIHVVYVGRFLREKGIFELMEAIRELRSKNVPFRISMCGDIDNGNLSSATVEECAGWLEDGLVDYMGRVNDVRQKLADSDIVVLPSYREGTPRSLLEAMATGRPIITTDVPGCRNVVEDGINGLMIPARSSDALVQAITQLIEDEPLRQKMSSESRLKAEREFDERIVIDQTLRVYHLLRPDVVPARDEWGAEESSSVTSLDPVPAAT